VQLWCSMKSATMRLASLHAKRSFGADAFLFAWCLGNAPVCHSFAGNKAIEDLGPFCHSQMNSRKSRATNCGPLSLFAEDLPITLDNQSKFRTSGGYHYRQPVEAGVTRKG
jgi:hypothetical protein